jgi:hypothetical protein
MYDMTRPAEAFGIFSNWLDGEDAKVGQRSRLLPGRLCFWQGHYYTRAYRAKGPGVPRTQLVELARQAARALGPNGALPPLAAALPAEALKPEDVRYLHTMDTLNSIYYVSTANVLDLSEKTEAVMAECTFDGEKAKVLVIAYPDGPARDRAWTVFCRDLLGKEPPGDGIATDELEPGKHAGVRRIGGGEGAAFLAICFEATTPDRCKHALAAVRPPGARHAEAP